jgi:hypothetical protein
MTGRGKAGPGRSRCESHAARAAGRPRRQLVACHISDKEIGQNMAIRLAKFKDLWRISNIFGMWALPPSDSRHSVIRATPLYLRS